MDLVVGKNIIKIFKSARALNKINLTLKAGEQYVIQGSSGSGKSTLLHLLGGLDLPTEGEVLISGRSLTEMNDCTLARYRSEIVGIVFQFHFLLSSMTCMDNMLLPGMIAGRCDRRLKDSILQLSKELSIEHCLNKYPFETSGGEQQRINIIRALSLTPQLLLCDEPTGNLDDKNSKIILKLLKDYASKYFATLVIVTHDSMIASNFSHKFYMKDGRLDLL